MPFTLGFLGFSDAFDAVEAFTDTGVNFLETFCCFSFSTLASDGGITCLDDFPDGSFFCPNPSPGSN